MQWPAGPTSEGPLRLFPGPMEVIVTSYIVSWSITIYNLKKGTYNLLIKGLFHPFTKYHGSHPGRIHVTGIFTYLDLPKGS